MSRIVILLILFAFTVNLSGQENKWKNQVGNECEFYPELVDSIYAYDWDSGANQWNAVAIRLYESSGGRYDRLLFINPADRSPVRAWDYFYDTYGNRNLEISTAWTNNTWIVNLKKESEFDQDKKKLSELRNYFKNAKWNFVSFDYWEYSGDNIDKVHYQVKDQNGVLYDERYTEYYYENDILMEVIGHDGLTGAITAKNRYVYEDRNNKLKEVIVFIPDEDDSNNFVPSTRNLFFYDEYSLLREQLFQRMKEGNWETYHKYVYFNKFDNSRKVAICHNNHTLCISVNALKAHLAHGDKLGSCKDEHRSVKEPKRSDNQVIRNAPFTVFPNPAKDRITVKIDNSEDHGISRIELLDSYGQPLRSFNTYQMDEIVINRGNLKNGLYYLKVTGKVVYSTSVIFQ